LKSDLKKPSKLKLKKPQKVCIVENRKKNYTKFYIVTIFLNEL